jgi:integrase
MTGKAINDVVQRCAERAEVRPFSDEGRESAGDVSAHTLRHSVAWRMLRAEEGNTLYDVRNRLRHATILTTEREYDHFQKI